MLLMFGDVYQFQNFQLRIFHHGAISECLNISYTKLCLYITAHECPY
jgi:hypothetical protein